MDATETFEAGSSTFPTVSTNHAMNVIAKEFLDGEVDCEYS